MNSVASEIDRFPIFELPDQGSMSLARRLVAVGGQLKLTNLILDTFALDLGAHEGTLEEQETIRKFIGERMRFVEKILAGKELKRPEWPISE